MGDTFPLGAQLRYPITIKRLLYKPGDELRKGSTAVDFSYKYMREVGDGTADETRMEEHTGYASWPSPVDGKLKSWKIKVGDVIKGDRPCAVIEEPCKHEVQFQGQCAYCGKLTDEVDWSTNRIDADRAPVRMTHDQANLTVSRERAAKTESLQQERLLKQRKLSLVVDLDQTVIHACIDPTVGEWQRDPTNPNYEAVKDVQSFQLNDDGPRGMASGCSYYIKMRPGLRQFLEKISQLYELHVYTMGTRAYAANIAKIVDPDKKLFGDRVISRDENGNMTAKSLQRLFPVSTNMVVIIDDRADVWPNNRPNLIKVVPYDFFKGVGDINSSFLPKREDILPTDKPVQNGVPKQNGDGDAAKVSALEGLAGMSSGDDAALLKLQTEEQERALEKQLTDRPLLHMQEKLDKEEKDAEMGDAEDETPESERATPPVQRHQVLFDDDNELKYLEHHLTVLHSKYYEAHSSNTDTSSIPDVGEILDDLKSEVLRGTRIVLSGLVPQEVDPLRSEIGMQAMSFGADLQTRIHSGITHLVVSMNRPRTAKVRTAAKIPSIKIVNQNWLQDSISQWEELDETPYLVNLHPADRGGAAEEEDDNDPRSPIDELKGFDFLGADEELDEFLADDSSEDDGDGKSEGGESKTDGGFDDDASTKSETGSEKGSISSKGKGKTVNGTAPSKRKHGDTDSESEQESSSTGSALSKKLRISRMRGGSSLRSAYTVESKTPKPEAASEQAQDQVNGSGADDGEEEVDLLKADSGATEAGEDDLEADLEDELENELMAALNREEQEALDEKG
ncbi:RNA polymerase II subunit A C-terminal domain phosphatase [Cytospora mali]|nr:RNA polymerase II subunit A C-terminal domain phosphatase [Valsa mali]